MHYCKTVCFRCILVLRFWYVEISLGFSRCSTGIYQVTRPLIGKLNFCGYLISQFNATREIRENFVPLLPRLIWCSHGSADTQTHTQTYCVTQSDTIPSPLAKQRQR